MFVLLAFLTVLRCSAATSPSKTPNTYLPRLPVGEYRLVYEAIYPCEDTKNHRIALNLYFSKKSRDVTEIRGNITFNVPVDDRLKFEVNVAQWGSTGGWVPNSLVFRGNKLCSDVKRNLGKNYMIFIRAFSSSVTDCPIPTGTYVSSGLNVRAFDDHALPKVFFYGRYKLVTYIKDDKDTLVGCAALEVRLVRPWEMAHY